MGGARVHDTSLNNVRQGGTDRLAFKELDRHRRSRLQKICGRTHSLQAYAGGSGNNPCVGWIFGTVPVFPGVWDLYDTPAQVESTMSAWHSQCGVSGGFMWLYDERGQRSCGAVR